MATRSPTEKSSSVRLDHETRKHQIAAACARLIARSGYNATSIRDVAAEVGISTGTLLHHFESKDELLTATLLGVSGSIKEQMEAELAKAREPADQLRRVVRALFSETEAMDIGWRVWIAFWHESTTRPELGDVASDLTLGSEALLAGLIARGIADGSFSCEDPDERAAELAALIDGLAIRVYGESGRWSNERAAAIVDRMIDSWLTPR